MIDLCILLLLLLFCLIGHGAINWKHFFDMLYLSMLKILRKIISDERFEVFRQIGFTAFWLKLSISLYFFSNLFGLFVINFKLFLVSSLNGVRFWRRMLLMLLMLGLIDLNCIWLKVRKGNFDIEKMQNSLYEIPGILKFFNV
jgi:hypothetical protein